MSEKAATQIRYLGLDFELQDSEKRTGAEGVARFRMEVENVPDEWDDWIVRVPFNRTGIPKIPDQVVWAWDGNREKPTLTPSFLYHAGDAWRVHFFMRSGVIEPCSDQTATVV